MLNKVILQGNIGRAPEIWTTQDGREIATFSLATNSSWKDSDGEWQTCTDWHKITVFRESTVRWIKDVLKKGDAVYVEGKLTYQHKTDKTHRARIIPHIVIFGYEGKVEHLRSRNSSTTKLRGDETSPLLTHEGSLCELESPPNKS
jgi:single-strand DNA-binding protein